MLYSKKVIQHFQNPKNMGQMKNPDVMAEVDNKKCGDLMRIYLRIEKGKIKDISFETMGCVSAIATSSMITEMAKGKTLDEAKKITYQDVTDELGQLPLIKVHCAGLAVETLRKAIEKYQEEN
ncbi:MAG: iron-sulfur cluster assembly scaffold protein [Candidatus Portnoybacteria bacterium]